MSEYTMTDWELDAIRRESQAAALRHFADRLNEVPDYQPTDYDRGRVDQRHMNARELYEVADALENY